ncbi:MAG: hypothetical protein ACD_56C00020G0009 [uncultured bacterium]|nr:MAG: hypothetical protein ACD_56C00020G0009 [uncultured bacterium]
MGISVIIVNYQSQQFLADCLLTLQKNFNEKIVEIIIVNNDSNRLSESFIANNPTLKIINLPSNQGFSKACNHGANVAKGEILFFLNPDTQIISADPAVIIKHLNTPQTGIIAPKLVSLNGEVQPWSAGKSINPLSLIKNNLGIIESKSVWENASLSSVDWVSGAAFLISKKLFLSIGGFDQNFFMYFEDVDFCQRIKGAGYNILRLPDFSVLHIGGQSYDNLSKQKSHYYQSQDYYFKKHFGLVAKILIKLLRNVSSFFSST